VVEYPRLVSLTANLAHQFATNQLARRPFQQVSIYFRFSSNQTKTYGWRANVSVHLSVFMLWLCTLSVANSQVAGRGPAHNSHQGCQANVLVGAGVWSPREVITKNHAVRDSSSAESPVCQTVGNHSTKQ